jgi:tungstate transport system substrate-binding protein
MRGLGKTKTTRRRYPVIAAASLLLTFVLILGLFVAACGGEDETTTTAAAETTTTAAEETTTTAAAEASDLILASTTSTQDSGLFDVLIPAFNEVYPQYTVKVIAVGSGEALKLGESGDADVLLVHSPAAEETFMENGFGIERKAVMYNDFIIVGSAADPAKIKGGTDAAAALKAIAAAQALFFTRGDQSGTHTKELSLWEKAEIEPAGDWYQTTGQGMGDTLTIADQQSGYTLSDRATYLTKLDSLALEILVEGDTALFNQYHVITCANGVNMQGASDFLNWIITDEVQDNVIGTFGVEEFGQPLFVPNAGEVE